jgi:hypothetical protein
LSQTFEVAFTSVAVRVHSSAATVPENTWTPIPWSTEVFDTDGFWDAAAPTKFTVPSGKAGKYLVNGQVMLAVGADGTQQLTRIRKNATTSMAEAQHIRNTTTAPTTPLISIVDLAAGDFLTFDVQHDTTGTDPAVVSGAAQPLSFFEMFRIGA